MHYHLIVHKENLEFEAEYMNNSAERKERAQKVLAKIEKILSTEENALLIPSYTDPRKIPNQIKPEDNVTICGCEINSCLAGTGMSLLLREIEYNYHPEACF